VPAKQRGKKQGKGTVNPGDGFASVACDSRRKQDTGTRSTSEVAFCSIWNRNSYCTPSSPLRASRSILMHARNSNNVESHGVILLCCPLIEQRNRSTANEFLQAERLGRGAYEPPRPGTLVPTDETVSTVNASGWPGDAHLGRCVSRRHDRRLNNLHRSAVGADGFDRWQDSSSFPS
jgi:hypothetical protein